MHFAHVPSYVLCLVALLATAACESAEERAEGHYQEALALLGSGDVDRALVELRNVFRNDPRHREARRLYATTALEELGHTTEAYGQFLRLVEQYPDDIPARLTLAELAVDAQNWDEAERHGRVAIAAAPEMPRARAIDLMLDYRDASRNEDPARRREIARAADALRAETENDLALTRIVIDEAVASGEDARALDEIARALAFAPDDLRLYELRLGLLQRMGDEAAVEAELVAMAERFPDDAAVQSTLLRYYVARGATAKAEAFLRAAVDPASEEIDDHVALIRFILQTRGREAALEELEAAIAATPDPLIFRTLRAGLVFDGGDRAAAIDEMEDIIADTAPSDELNRAKVALARMLESTDNKVGARARVAEVLEADPTMVEALKMEARWLTEGDRADAAIARLRTALDQAPQDAEAMTLMAEAHTRNGNHELAQDMLSLAVEASGSAPEETLRYARALASEGRWRPAEGVLIDALRMTPGQVALLTLLGQVYVGMEDWPRAEDVVATLRRAESETAATRAAEALEVAILSRQERTDEALAALEAMAGSGDAASQAAVIRGRLVAGDGEGALAYAERVAADDPSNLARALLLATTRAATGDVAGAEADYRALTERAPEAEMPWLQLARILAAQGQTTAARDVVAEGLNHLPASANLLWAEAGYLEQVGDVDGAIAIYERLYEQNSDSPVIANNLASLLATYRDDDESLARAYAVARRLRGTDVPAFQDTYGWILHRRGENAEALAYLEGAARGLPEDALAQYHLAEAYTAEGRADDALAQYRQAVEVAGEDDARPQIQRARAKIAAVHDEDGAGNDGDREATGASLGATVE